MKELIKRLDGGDIKALEQIYDAMAEQIFEYGYKKTQNSFLAEKILEDTMCEIVQNSYKYNAHRNAEKWIFSLTKKVTTKLIKEKKDIRGKTEADSEESVYLMYNSDGFVAAEKKKYILERCVIPEREEWARNRKKYIMYKRITIGVSIILAMVLMCIVPKVIIKTKDYIIASNFFKENKLVKAELSWEDMVIVYRDISLDSFTDEKTIKVVESSVKQAGINGEMLVLPDSATTKEMFNLLNNNKYEDIDVELISSENIVVDSLTCEVTSSKLVVKKYVNEQLVWSYESDGKCYDANSYLLWENNVIVYGTRFNKGFNEPDESYIIMLDANGNELWDIQLDTEYEDVLIEDIVVNKDFMAVFSTANDEMSSFFTQIDKNGNILKSHKANMKYCNISKVSVWEDGYIILREPSWLNMDYTFRFLDEDGNKKDEDIFMELGEEYSLYDMVTLNGEIYISGYVENREYVDIANGKPFREEDDPKEIERTTRIYREQYRAVLWRYNEDNKCLDEVYSILGAKGQRLEVIDGKLHWSAIGIDEYKWFGGSGVWYVGQATKYKYVIGKNMEIESKIKTNEHYELH